MYDAPSETEFPLDGHLSRAHEVDDGRSHRTKDPRQWPIHPGERTQTRDSLSSGHDTVPDYTGTTVGPSVQSELEQLAPSIGELLHLTDTATGQLAKIRNSQKGIKVQLVSWMSQQSTDGPTTILDTTTKTANSSINVPDPLALDNRNELAGSGDSVPIYDDSGADLDPMPLPSSATPTVQPTKDRAAGSTSPPHLVGDALTEPTTLDALPHHDDPPTLGTGAMSQNIGAATNRLPSRSLTPDDVGSHVAPSWTKNKSSPDGHVSRCNLVGGAPGTNNSLDVKCQPFDPGRSSHATNAGDDEWKHDIRHEGVKHASIVCHDIRHEGVKSWKYSTCSERTASKDEQATMTLSRQATTMLTYHDQPSSMLDLQVEVTKD